MRLAVVAFFVPFVLFVPLVFVYQTYHSPQARFDHLAMGTPLEGHQWKPSALSQYIDGKGGTDTVYYSGARAGYEVFNGTPTSAGVGTILVHSLADDSIDVIVNVEYLRFADETLQIPSLIVVSETPPAHETNGISIAILTELQDMGSPLAQFYLGTQIQEGVATVTFRSGAEPYLNAPDTIVSPIKNDLLKMQGISLVRWQVDGKSFAKFTK